MVLLLFAFVIKASFMQQSCAGCALSPPAAIATPVMLLVEAGSFSPNAFPLLPPLWLWLCSPPLDQLGREIVKFFYKRERKMVKGTLFILF